MTTTITIAAKAPVPASVKLHLASAYNDRPLRVLCATDLSARSDNAVQRTLALAEASDFQSLLLHVVDREAPLSVIGCRADRARSALQWHIRQLRSPEPSPAISVRIGRPHRTIAHVSKDWGADLIVLGAYRSRTADWLLGTTAERLARGVDCPILVVNRESSTDYSEVTLAAGSLDGATSLARTLNRLAIVQSSRPRYRAIVHSSAFPGRGARPCPDAMQLARGDLSSQGFELIDLHGASVDVVARTVIRQAPQLIATDLGRCPAAGRLLGRSIASRLVRNAACDVLIAPRAQARNRRIRVPRRMFVAQPQ